MANEILSVIEEAIRHYRPEGEFAVTRAEQLKEKKATVIPEMQARMIGRGLAGTTVGAAIPTAFEQQVAKPWRTETEMMRGGRLMETIMAKAGIMERTEARAAQETLAREEMALREKLANRQITSQEYMAALDRAQRRATGGVGAGAVGGAGARLAPDIPRKYVPGLGMTTAYGDTDADAGGYGADYGGVGAGYAADAGDGVGFGEELTVMSGGKEVQAGKRDISTPLWVRLGLPTPVIGSRAGLPEWAQTELAGR